MGSLRDLNREKLMSEGNELANTKAPEVDLLTQNNTMLSYVQPICVDCNHFLLFKVGRDIDFVPITKKLCKAHPLPTQRDPINGHILNYPYEKCQDVNGQGQCGKFSLKPPQPPKKSVLKRLVTKLFG